MPNSVIHKECRKSGKPDLRVASPAMTVSRARDLDFAQRHEQILPICRNRVV